MCTSDLVVGHSHGQKLSNIAILLELAAADDLEGFRLAVEEEGYDVDDSGLWYGRSVGSKKMSLEERTPLMIASVFASKQVLKFILGLNRVDVNKACGSDKVTALHMAVSGGSSSSIEVVKLLIDASADINSVDVNGNRPVDLIPLVFGGCFNSKRKYLELMLSGCSDSEELYSLSELTELTDDRVHIHGDEHKDVTNSVSYREGTEKKESSRARELILTIGPNARLFIRARTLEGETLESTITAASLALSFEKDLAATEMLVNMLMGIFECWLHPAQYRTRLCKDEVGCSRKVCFFAHKVEELRPLHPSTGSAVLSPRSMSLKLSDISSISPFSLGAPSIMIPPSSTPPITPRGFISSRWAYVVESAIPNLKALSSRFKTTPNGRELDFEAEMIRVDRYRQQQLMDEFAGLSPPSNWNNN
ncbi:hypothetical protein OSB04_un001535, partial [Centaurea solstitialis]